MIYIVLYTEKTRNIAAIFHGSYGAVKLLLDLKKRRISQHIVYGVDSIQYDTYSMSLS